MCCQRSDGGGESSRSGNRFHNVPGEEQFFRFTQGIHPGGLSSCLVLMPVYFETERHLNAGKRALKIYMLKRRTNNSLRLRGLSPEQLSHLRHPLLLLLLSPLPDTLQCCCRRFLCARFCSCLCSECFTPVS